MFFSQKILEFISWYAPANCPICGNAPFDGTPGMFCSQCLVKLEFISGTRCPGCGGELDGIFKVCKKCMALEQRPWNTAYSLFEMRETIRECIIKYKYRNHTEFARPLGILLGRYLKNTLPNTEEYVLVPIPLHWTRHLQRGFNQAEILCRFVSHETGYPVVRGLKRIRRTNQQAKLNREERIKNLNGAFSGIHRNKWLGKHILLLDDVFTTGTTLTVASQELIRQGAEHISVITLARR